jgi:hypothetical protein
MITFEVPSPRQEIKLGMISKHLLSMAKRMLTGYLRLQVVQYCVILIPP